MCLPCLKPLCLCMRKLHSGDLEIITCSILEVLQKLAAKSQHNFTLVLWNTILGILFTRAFSLSCSTLSLFCPFHHSLCVCVLCFFVVFLKKTTTMSGDRSASNILFNDLICRGTSKNPERLNYPEKLVPCL